MKFPFRDRADAGRRLAERLRPFAAEKPLVLALPRGGVPVAAEIAQAIAAPLDLLMVRKIGHPQQPELALGAAVDGGDPVIVVNGEIARHAGLTHDEVTALAGRELAEIERRRIRYTGSRQPLPVRDRSIIVVDDGIATGATVKVSIRALRRRGAARIIVATPVAPHDVLGELQRLVEDVVCLAVPEPFLAVGNAYVDFEQVDDRAVVALLSQVAGGPGG